MKVAAVQHDIAWESPADTCARVAPSVAEAARGGARLVALAEMFGAGFSMATDRIAEAPDGPSTAFLVEQARARRRGMAHGPVSNTPAGREPARQSMRSRPPSRRACTGRAADCGANCRC